MLNPYLQWQHADPPPLVGRQDMLKDLLRAITATVTHAVQVVAVQGMGSTTLLRYLAHPNGLWKNPTHRHYLTRPFNQPNRLLSVYVDMKLFTGSSLAAWLCHTLSLHPMLRPFMPAEMASDTLPMVPLVNALVQLEQRDVRVVLLLDHLDRVLKDLPPQEASQLRPLAGRAVIVVATEQPLMRLRPDSVASWLGTSLHTVRLGLLEMAEARDLLRAPVPAKHPPPTADEAKHLLALTGLIPGLIIRGAAEWWDVRERYGRALSNPDLFAFLRARLRDVFGPDFGRYWNKLPVREQTALAQTAQPILTPEPGLISTLDDLWLSGLLQRDPQKNIFKPFSELWQAYILERWQERQIAAETPPPLPSSLRGRSFISRDTALLEFFRARPNQVLDYAEIVRAVWQLDSPENGLDALRMAVKRLRQTLAAKSAPEEIINHRQRGYEYRRLG